MNIKFIRQGRSFEALLQKGKDISLPLSPDGEGVNAYYAPPFRVSPVVHGSFIGSTREGGSVNFLNVQVNPHGNGTHTECVGHIARESISIQEVLKDFHFAAELISVFPTKTENGDRVITRRHMEEAVQWQGLTEALIVRTLPNEEDKKKRNYSGTNPPYFDVSAIEFMLQSGIQHLLTDLPSVDREEDGGRLSAHKAFWNYPQGADSKRTITELIFANNEIKDGLYLLLLQITSFDIDVSPSKPVLFEVNEKK